LWPTFSITAWLPALIIVIINLVRSGMDQRCIECLERSTLRLINKYKLTGEAELQFNEWYRHWLANSGHSIVELQQHINRKLSAITGIGDLYHDEKMESNRQALQLYAKWKPRVEASGDPLLLALKLAVAGNVIDYGAQDTFDLEATIQKVIETPFAIDHSALLRKQLAHSRRILYLADNAGEIVFDRLLIETINHPNIALVVRGGPVLNDATKDDAMEAGIERVAEIIDSGLAIPSTMIDESSDELKSHFREADLILSKGQGNLEGLISLQDSRIFFLLMAKCDVMAEKLGIAKGSFVVMNQIHGR